MIIILKRAYEPAQPQDGMRILVDRLWPRGITKQKAHIDLWVKDVAPSSTLRKWFNHDPQKWLEFKQRYRDELDNNKPTVETLKRQLSGNHVTFVYSAKDEIHNAAIVLKEYLESSHS